MKGFLYRLGKIDTDQAFWFGTVTGFSLLIISVYYPLQAAFGSAIVDMLLLPGLILVTISIALGALGQLLALFVSLLASLVSRSEYEREREEEAQFLNLCMGAVEAMPTERQAHYFKLLKDAMQYEHPRKSLLDKLDELVAQAEKAISDEPKS